jgi:undecaprenyl diphosphate synthase
MFTKLINPIHLAIIMDGNGRWAQAKGLPRLAGHKKGSEVARTIIQEASNIGIKYLTLYAFSSENWNRDKEEVSGIFKLLGLYLDQEQDKFQEMGLKVRFIGNISKLPQELQDKIAQTEAATASNDGLNLVIALSYGARDEILQACAKLSSSVTAEEFAQALYTRNIPDPDFLIRTGGEYRLSNFLLWQLAYTELYFTKTLWPDFTSQDLKVALDEFQNRNRRYGR